MTSPNPARTLFGLSKLTVCAIVAAFVVLALFAFMKMLVQSEEIVLAEPKPLPDLALQPPQRDEDVKRRRRDLELEDTTITPPPPPRGETAKSEAPTESFGEVALPDLKAQAGPGEFDLPEPTIVERPIFRPVTYPQTAISRGIGGQCVVTVDVEQTGRVVNPRASCSDNVFVRSVERDALRWKYQPRMDKGETVLRRNLTVIVDFELPD